MIREPNDRACTGYDAMVSVPLDQHYYRIGKSWSSSKDETKRRIGKLVAAHFHPLLNFESIRDKYGQKPQVETAWHRANTLRIDSLEYMASDCDIIVRGLIEDVVMIHKGDYKSSKNYESTIDKHVIRFRVDETLKGKCGKFITVALHNGGSLSAWRKNKTPIVLFLKDTSMRFKGAQSKLVGVKYAFHNPIVRYDGRGPDTKAIIALEERQPEVFSLRKGWVRQPKTMLRLVREYLARTPAARKSLPRERRRSVSFRPPPSLLNGTHWENHRYVHFRFPIDGELERQTRRWLRSDDQDYRWMGAFWMVYFKSDKNADALRPLLGDPGKWPQPSRPYFFGREKVTYLARWEAWTILNAWGYEVSQPALRD